MSDDDKNIIKNLLENLIIVSKRTHPLKLPIELALKSYLPDLLESFDSTVGLFKIDWEYLIGQLNDELLDDYLHRPKLVKYIKDKLKSKKYIGNYKFVIANMLLFRSSIKIPSTWTISQVKEFSSIYPGRIDIDSIINLVYDSSHDFFFILENILKDGKHQFSLVNSSNRLITTLKLVINCYKNGLISERKTLQIIEDYYVPLCSKDILHDYSTVYFSDVSSFLFTNWKYLLKIALKIENDPNLTKIQFYRDNLEFLSKHILTDQELENMIRLYEEVIKDPHESCKISLMIFNKQLPKRRFKLKDNYVKSIINMMNITSIDDISVNTFNFFYLREYLKLSFGFKFYEQYWYLLDKKVIERFLVESNQDCVIDLLLRCKSTDLYGDLLTGSYIPELIIWTLKDYIQWEYILNNNKLSQEFLIKLIPWYNQTFGNINLIVKTQYLGNKLTEKYNDIIDWTIAVKNPKIIDNYKYIIIT